MDVDWTRLALGAEVGLGIGALILVGWLGTRWLLNGRLGAMSWLQIALSIAIIAVSTGAYGLFSYRTQPGRPAAAAVDPATIAPSAGGAAGAPPVQQAVAIPPPLPHAQVDAGGVVLKFDAPEGYCLYPADLMAVVLAMHKQANRDNVVHTAFGDCDQLRSHAESGARIKDFGLVMTPTATVGKPLTRTSLDDFAREMIDATKIREGVAQRLHEAVARLDMQSFSSVGILDRDDSSIYFGFLSKLHVGEETFTQASVLALMIVRSRLVSLYLYSDYTKTPRTTLQTLLTKSKASVVALSDLNK